ncbi:MAG: DUF1080 domain-containing protein [Planctomycetota bacterium]
MHDRARPRPQIIVPGKPLNQSPAGAPPSDAIVLFDGTDLSQWCHQVGDNLSDLRQPQWKVVDGAFEVLPGAGGLQTIGSFGSCQLHLEWASPKKVVGDSQNRGNSGVLLMGQYEIQILDSFQNRTYADGQAGAVYGQFPPEVNVVRQPGQWNSYDIVFYAPKFDPKGVLLEPARVTVLHNGVLLHHNRELVGPVGHKVVQEYQAGTPAAPLVLQDHGCLVRFRNVWVRRLN